jgi:hypothetical protein
LCLGFVSLFEPSAEMISSFNSQCEGFIHSMIVR